MNNSYIIAEMACSHDGYIKNAMKIIDAAIHAKANAIQLQIWKHQNLVVPDHSDIKLLKSIELTENDWSSIVNYIRSKSQDIEIIACIYDKEAADFAFYLGVEAFKIHTSDLSNFSLLEHVANFERRIDLSVGSSTYEEISNALFHLKPFSKTEIWLMYGKQLFPTKIIDANILQAVNLQKVFGIPVGYQDHTDGDTEEAITIPLIARGAGITIHEKHLTHNRELKGADYQAALNPDEFYKFVKCMRDADIALGESTLRPFSKAELDYRVYSKKSIVFSTKLNEGHFVTKDDVIFLRSEKPGFLADEIENVLGRKLVKSVNQYQTVTPDHLE